MQVDIAGGWRRFLCESAASVKHSAWNRPYECKLADVAYVVSNQRMTRSIESEKILLPVIYLNPRHSPIL